MRTTYLCSSPHCDHELWVVTGGMRFLSGVVAPRHQKEPAESVQASGRDAFQMPPRGADLDTSHWDEVSGSDPGLTGEIISLSWLENNSVSPGGRGGLCSDCCPHVLVLDKQMETDGCLPTARMNTLTATESSSAP